MATLIGIGVNLPEDVVYPDSFVDAEGKPYSGVYRYMLRFEGKLPPADAFWSVTSDKDGFQSPDSLNRFTIGDREKRRFDADGPLDIYAQNKSPGLEKDANWLPAHASEFNLAMCLYSPCCEVLNGTWTPPPVKQANRKRVLRLLSLSEGNS